MAFERVIQVLNPSKDLPKRPILQGAEQLATGQFWANLI